MEETKLTPADIAARRLAHAAPALLAALEALLDTAERVHEDIRGPHGFAAILMDLRAGMSDARRAISQARGRGRD